MSAAAYFADRDPPPVFDAEGIVLASNVVVGTTKSVRPFALNDETAPGLVVAAIEIEVDGEKHLIETVVDIKEHCEWPLVRAGDKVRLRAYSFKPREVYPVGSFWIEWTNPKDLDPQFPGLKDGDFKPWVSESGKVIRKTVVGDLIFLAVEVENADGKKQTVTFAHSPNRCPGVALVEEGMPVSVDYRQTLPHAILGSIRIGWKRPLGG